MITDVEHAVLQPVGRALDVGSGRHARDELREPAEVETDARVPVVAARARVSRDRGREPVGERVTGFCVVDRGVRRT